jgi:hypothetical protein
MNKMGKIKLSLMTRVLTEKLSGIIAGKGVESQNMSRDHHLVKLYKFKVMVRESLLGSAEESGLMSRITTWYQEKRSNSMPIGFH